MTEKSYDTPCGSIHYWVSRAVEKAYTLVFLPGLTADHRLFERQLAYFALRCPVLVWDAPGHGRSWPFRLDFTLMEKARWLEEILQREALPPPVLVGQSMGGYVAQAFMQQFPGRAKGFVSVDSAPLQRQYVTGAELYLLQRMEPVYRWYPWSLLVWSGSVGCAVSPYGQEMMRRMMDAYTGDRPRYAALAGHGYRMLAQAMAADLPYRIDCPALLLCGRKDQAGSTRRYNKAWHRCTGIPLVWLENAGHNSNCDKPQLVNALLERFVAQL